MIDPVAKSTVYAAWLAYALLMLVPVALRLGRVDVATWLLWLTPFVAPLCFVVLFLLLLAVYKLLRAIGRLLRPERSAAHA